jgi:hypothetical protein
MSGIARNRAFEDVSSAAAGIKPPWSDVLAMTDRDRDILSAELVVVQLLLVSAIVSMASFFSKFRTVQFKTSSSSP